MIYPERRRNLRADTNLDVRVGFIFPEQVFPVTDKDGRALDIGEQGMKIRLSEISEDFYEMLSTAKRSAKVSFTLPTTQRANHILSRIVWVGFNPQTQECLVGLRFKQIKPEIRQEVHDYVEVRSKR